MIFHMLTWT